jgi:hypothetical protein
MDHTNKYLKNSQIKHQRLRFGAFLLKGTRIDV